jgi:hypothetical protein
MEQCHDSPLQTLVMTLQQEKEKLSADLSETLLRVRSLEVSMCSGLIAGENSGMYLNKVGD